MQEYFTVKKGNGKLVVFVLGWAADHRFVQHITPQGYDVLTIYDYRDMEIPDLRDTVSCYGDVTVIGWSFGVRIAEIIFSGLPVAQAIAFNGTPFPVDGEYGIEPRRLEVTLRGIRSGGMDAFGKRAFGKYYESSSRVDFFPRDTAQNILELENLKKLSSEALSASLNWEKAVIGSGDLIFPPENMLRYWKEKAKIETEIVPLPHYPFEDPAIVYDEIRKIQQ